MTHRRSSPKDISGSEFSSYTKGLSSTLMSKCFFSHYAQLWPIKASLHDLVAETRLRKFAVPQFELESFTIKKSVYIPPTLVISGTR